MSIALLLLSSLFFALALLIFVFAARNHWVGWVLGATALLLLALHDAHAAIPTASGGCGAHSDTEAYAAQWADSGVIDLRLFGDSDIGLAVSVCQADIATSLPLSGRPVGTVAGAIGAGVWSCVVVAPNLVRPEYHGMVEQLPQPDGSCIATSQGGAFNRLYEGWLHSGAECDSRGPLAASSFPGALDICFVGCQYVRSALGQPAVPTNFTCVTPTDIPIDIPEPAPGELPTLDPVVVTPDPAPSGDGFIDRDGDGQTDPNPVPPGPDPGPVQIGEGQSGDCGFEPAKCARLDAIRAELSMLRQQLSDRDQREGSASDGGTSCNAPPTCSGRVCGSAEFVIARQVYALRCAAGSPDGDSDGLIGGFVAEQQVQADADDLLAQVTVADAASSAGSGAGGSLSQSLYGGSTGSCALFSISVMGREVNVGPICDLIALIRLLAIAVASLFGLRIVARGF